MSELTNESAVLDIYSNYKRSREVIDLEQYLDLLASAREAVELKQHEHELQKILKMAVNAQSAGQTVKPIHVYSEPSPALEESGEHEFIGSIKQLGKKVVDVIMPFNLMSTPMRGMSMVSGIAILGLGFSLFGSALFNLEQLDDYPKSDYVADVFLENEQLIAQLIAGNQDWQYSFSTNTGPATNAFQAGELVVDLSFFGQTTFADEATRSGSGVKIGEQSIGQRLRAHEPYADKSIEIPMVSDLAVRKIQAKLTVYYSKQEGQAQMFQFGQWLEYHYLLSRLAVVAGRVAVYQNNYLQHQDLMAQLEAHLRAKNLLTEDDIIRMKESPRQNMTLENLDQLSTLLLKIKSVLAYA
ncbi:MAG: hypothetical protein ACI9WC_001378 [Arenicella sp.]|jgi:hypothetical protein